jgi:hypothetical protein
MKQIFSTIETALLAGGVIQQVELWNNQLDKLEDGKEDPIAFPAAFVEFTGIQYSDNSKGKQTGELTVKVYVSNFRIVHDRLAIFDLRDAVQEVLHTLKAPGCSPLSRRREQQDTNYDGLITWVMEYDAKFEDTVADTERAWVEVEPLLIVQKQ